MRNIRFVMAFAVLATTVVGACSGTEEDDGSVTTYVVEKDSTGAVKVTEQVISAADFAKLVAQKQLLQDLHERGAAATYIGDGLQPPGCQASDLWLYEQVNGWTQTPPNKWIGCFRGPGTDDLRVAMDHHQGGPWSVSAASGWGGSFSQRYFAISGALTLTLAPFQQGNFTATNSNPPFQRLQRVEQF